MTELSQLAGRHIGKLVVAAVALLLAACSSGPERLTAVNQDVSTPYGMNGTGYVPQKEQAYDFVGVASWYGNPYHGRHTASGEIFDMTSATAAHRTLPFGTRVKVTNLENGRSIVLRINDRGPFVRHRIIDVSKGAAQALGFVRQGTARVRVQLVRLAPR